MKNHSQSLGNSNKKKKEVDIVVVDVVVLKVITVKMVITVDTNFGRRWSVVSFRRWELI
jgi:hypothetical protein